MLALAMDYLTMHMPDDIPADLDDDCTARCASIQKTAAQASNSSVGKAFRDVKDLKTLYNKLDGPVSLDECVKMFHLHLVPKDLTFQHVDWPQEESWRMENPPPHGELAVRAVEAREVLRHMLEIFARCKKWKIKGTKRQALKEAEAAAAPPKKKTPTPKK